MPIKPIVPREKAIPLEPLVPDKATAVAMREARKDKLKRFDDVDTLMADLRAKD